MEQGGGSALHISTKCSIAIHCLVCIHEYGKAKKVTSELLALSAGANPVTIRNILGALKRDGILSIKMGAGGAALNCPLEEITLYRICKAIEPDFLAKLIGVHSAPSPFCPVGRNIHSLLDKTYSKIHSDLSDSLRSVTMREIVDQFHQMADSGG